MKQICFFIYLLPLFACTAQQKTIVQPVAEEILSTFNNVRDFTINSVGDEAYFSLQSPMGELSAIVRIQKKNGQWTESKMVNFSGEYQDLEPFLTSDGLQLYFASNRPKYDTSTIAGDYDIWKVERRTTSDKWSEPINIGAPINSEHNEFYASIASNGNFYFTSDAPTGKGKDDIYISKWTGGKYENPISLNDSINTEGYEFNAFIAPDESYLIFSGYNREDGFGSGDLYISYNKNGQWTKAQNLGDKINSKQIDYCPYVNTETNTLYFTSKRNAIDVATSKFESIIEYLEVLEQTQNGLSKIYKVDISEWLEN